MLDFKTIKQELLDLLKNQHLHQVLLFGSYARGAAREESDVDLLVILDKKGMSGSYAEVLENKKFVSMLLRELRKKIPIDLLVYTKDEWAALKKSGSSFIQQIEREGIRLA
jgi:predicted nucleotidyltransferase